MTIDPDELVPSDEAARKIHQRPETLTAWAMKGGARPTSKLVARCSIAAMISLHGSAPSDGIRGHHDNRGHRHPNADRAGNPHAAPRGI
jgi:hypothetical protein